MPISPEDDLMKMLNAHTKVKAWEIKEVSDAKDARFELGDPSYVYTFDWLRSIWMNGLTMVGPYILLSAIPEMAERPGVNIWNCIALQMYGMERHEPLNKLYRTYCYVCKTQDGFGLASWIDKKGAVRRALLTGTYQRKNAERHPASSSRYKRQLAVSTLIDRITSSECSMLLYNVNDFEIFLVPDLQTFRDVHQSSVISFDTLIPIVKDAEYRLADEPFDFLVRRIHLALDEALQAISVNEITEDEMDYFSKIDIASINKT